MDFLSTIDINDPGDLIFANCVLTKTAEPPKCAGWDEATIVDVPVKYKSGDKLVITRIICPDSCPRDVKSQKRRCKGLEYFNAFPPSSADD